ncbi:MAG: hypothetical protein HZC50_08470 [Nitrospirae bacterium]|nr:hypothetical protein [Nitrospirota bacterium]
MREPCRRQSHAALDAQPMARACLLLPGERGASHGEHVASLHIPTMPLLPAEALVAPHATRAF